MRWKNKLLLTLAILFLQRILCLDETILTSGFAVEIKIRTISGALLYIFDKTYNHDSAFDKLAIIFPLYFTRICPWAV